MNWSEQGQARLCGGVGRPPALLRRLYEDEDYSLSRLSNVFDCSTSVIIEDLCDIGVLDVDELFPDRFPRLTTTEYGRWWHGPHRVRVHRLLMVAEEGFEAVANAVEIHHESFKWDNRSDALVLCETRQEHKDLHADRPGEHEDQREVSEFDDSQMESSEVSDEPEEDNEADVEIENQRTLDEFVRV